MGVDASAVEESTVLTASQMRRVALLLAFGTLSACPKPPTSDESLPPEVILSGARLRSFRGSELAATGRAAQVTYQRTTADLTASEVLLRFPPRQSGGPSPALGLVEVRAPAVVGNRLTQQADGRDGVWVRTGSGLVGRTRQERVANDADVSVHPPSEDWRFSKERALRVGLLQNRSLQSLSELHSRRPGNGESVQHRGSGHRASGVRLQAVGLRGDPPPARDRLRRGGRPATRDGAGRLAGNAKWVGPPVAGSTCSHKNRYLCWSTYSRKRRSFWPATSSSGRPRSRSWMAQPAKASERSPAENACSRRSKRTDRVSSSRAGSCCGISRLTMTTSAINAGPSAD